MITISHKLTAEKESILLPRGFLSFWQAGRLRIMQKYKVEYHLMLQQGQVYFFC